MVLEISVVVRLTVHFFFPTGNDLLGVLSTVSC